MQVELVGLGETLMRRNLMRFADSLALPAAGLEAAGIVLRRTIEQQFATEGEHASGGWAPLAASTVQQKARKGLRPEILRATDRMMQSLTSRFDPEHVEEMAGPDALRFGSRVPYAIFHQTGTSRMPRRRPVALTETDKVEIAKAIQFALVRPSRMPA